MKTLIILAFFSLFSSDKFPVNGCSSTQRDRDSRPVSNRVPSTQRTILLTTTTATTGTSRTSLSSSSLDTQPHFITGPLEPMSRTETTRFSLATTFEEDNTLGTLPTSIVNAATTVLEMENMLETSDALVTTLGNENQSNVTIENSPITTHDTEIAPSTTLAREKKGSTTLAIAKSPNTLMGKEKISNTNAPTITLDKQNESSKTLPNVDTSTTPLETENTLFTTMPIPNESKTLLFIANSSSITQIAQKISSPKSSVENTTSSMALTNIPPIPLDITKSLTITQEMTEITIPRLEQIEKTSLKTNTIRNNQYKTLFASKTEWDLHPQDATDLLSLPITSSVGNSQTMTQLPNISFYEGTTSNEIKVIQEDAVTPSAQTSPLSLTTKELAYNNHTSKNATGYTNAIGVPGTFTHKLLKLHQQGSEWNEAKEACAREGAVLAVIDTPTKRKDVLQLFIKHHEDIVADKTNSIFVGDISGWMKITIGSYGYSYITNRGVYWCMRFNDPEKGDCPGLIIELARDTLTDGFSFMRRNCDPRVRGTPCSHKLAFVCEKDIS